MITAPEAIERLVRIHGQVKNGALIYGSNIFVEIAELIRHQQGKIEELQLTQSKWANHVLITDERHNHLLRCEMKSLTADRAAANTKLRSDQDKYPFACGDCDPCLGGRPDQCAFRRPETL